MTKVSDGPDEGNAGKLPAGARIVARRFDPEPCRPDVAPADPLEPLRAAADALDARDRIVDRLHRGDDDDARKANEADALARLAVTAALAPSWKLKGTLYPAPPLAFPLLSRTGEDIADHVRRAALAALRAGESWRVAMVVREVLAGIAMREREGATDWRPALQHALARAAADARACELAGDHRAGAVLAALELLRAGLDAPGDPDATFHLMRAADAIARVEMLRLRDSARGALPAHLEPLRARGMFQGKPAATPVPEAVAERAREAVAVASALTGRHVVGAVARAAALAFQGTGASLDALSPSAMRAVATREETFARMVRELDAWRVYQRRDDDTARAGAVLIVGAFVSPRRRTWRESIEAAILRPVEPDPAEAVREALRAMGHNPHDFAAAARQRKARTARPKSAKPLATGKRRR